MNKWYAYLRDGWDGAILETYGPAPLSELEAILPEPAVNDRGEPVEYIAIERA